MSGNEENNGLYQQMETLAKLQSDQIAILLQKIDDLTTKDQERHNNLKEEIELMKVTREAQMEQMTQFQQGLDHLEETTVALMSISNDLQPTLQQVQAQTLANNAR